MTVREWIGKNFSDKEGYVVKSNLSTADNAIAEQVFMYAIKNHDDLSKDLCLGEIPYVYPGDGVAKYLWIVLITPATDEQTIEDWMNTEYEDS